MAMGNSAVALMSIASDSHHMAIHTVMQIVVFAEKVRVINAFWVSTYWSGKAKYRHSAAIGPAKNPTR